LISRCTTFGSRASCKYAKLHITKTEEKNYNSQEILSVENFLHMP
jgi:hypothetical protein